VLHDDVDKILKLGFAVKDLPFPVDDIFLQIKCYVFGNSRNISSYPGSGCAIRYRS